MNLLAALALSASALAVAWVGFLLGGRRLAVVAGLLMAFLAANRYLQYDANTEVFMLLPLVLSTGACIAGVQRKEARWFLLGGALAGLAAMTKTVALLNVFAIVAALVWGGCVGQLDWPSARRWSAAFVGGTAFVLVLTVLPFIIGGAFDEFWHANVTYNLAYNEQVPSFAKIFRFSQVDGRSAGALPVWTLAAIGVVMACRSLPSLPVALLIGSAVASFLGIASTGQQFPHYFVALTPFAAIFAAMALIEMTRGWGTSLRRRLHVETLLLVLTLPPALALLPVYVLSVDKAYEISHPNIDGSRAIDNEAIAGYLASMSPPGEPFYVVGREPQLYVLADRRPSAYYAWGARSTPNLTRSTRPCKNWMPILLECLLIHRSSKRPSSTIQIPKDSRTNSRMNSAPS